jgi:hypothetical protein
MCVFFLISQYKTQSEIEIEKIWQCKNHIMKHDTATYINTKTDFSKCLEQWKMAGRSASSRKGDYFEGDSPYYCGKFTTVRITSEIQILLEWPKYFYILPQV